MDNLLKCLSSGTVEAIEAARNIREETISDEMARALLVGALQDEIRWTNAA